MQTDKIFHKLFSYFPEIFFELIWQPELAQHYHGYKSEEVKETAFRLDGIVEPKSEPYPLLFVEVQMQHDEEFYHRVFAELFVFMKQRRWNGTWKVIVLFKTKANEPKRVASHQVFFEQGLIEVLYLRPFLKGFQRRSLGLDVLRLVVATQKEAIPLAKSLMEITHRESANEVEQNLGEMIETIMLYKFSKLSREEVQVMLDLGFDVKKTVLYQEALAEGKAEGEEHSRHAFAEGLIEVLTDRFGIVPESIKRRIFSADTHTLKDYYKQAWKAASLEEMFP